MPAVGTPEPSVTVMFKVRFYVLVVLRSGV